MVPYQQALSHKLAIEDGLGTVTLDQLRAKDVQQALTVNWVSSCETVCKLDGKRATMPSYRSKQRMKLF